MKIGLDFDGVIVNSAKLKSNVCKILFGVPLPLKNCEVGLLNGIITPEQYETVREEAYTNRKFSKFMEPVEGAIETIKALLDDGHKLRIVTSRVGAKVDIAKEWLAKNKLELEIVGVGENKSKKFECKNFDVFIDDKPKNLAALGDVVPRIFLFSWPYNQGNAIGQRISSWKQLYSELQNLELSGFTIWFTGLSGSGKSTIADKITSKLRESGKKVVLLDGDIVRRILSPDLGYSKADRDRHITRVANVCALLTRNGIINIACVISPTKKIREYARQRIGDNFAEIYVKCSLEECEKRDVKGHYSKVRSGEMAEFVGITVPYEEPADPDLTLDTRKETVKESVTKLLNFLKTKIN